jgi:hypothetical protein
MQTLAPPRPAPESSNAPAPARTPDRTRTAPGLDLLFTLVFALFGWGVGIERLSDNSFFWHLRAGDVILDRGIPFGDVFSFTARGHHWVAQSWLAETVYAGLDRTFGPFGIRVLCGLVGVAITVLVFRLALHLARDRTRAALLSIAALAGLYTLWSERPLLFGVLLLVALLWVVEAPRSFVGRHALIAIPAIFWLWANVHGTFALGFLYLGLHLVGRWLEGHRPWTGRERTLLTGAAIGFVACFVNPYGISLVTFPIDLLRRGDALRGVIEWSSPDFHSVRGLSFALWIVVFAVVLARAPRGRVTLRDLVVTVPFLLLALWALRNVPLAPLVCLPVAARAVAVPHRRDDPPLSIGWALSALVVAVMVLMGVRAAAQPDFALGSYPVRAMAAIDHQGLLGHRLLVDDADAGYVILRYWPRQHVFMDDRFDMYPMSVVQDFTTVNGGTTGWDQVLDRRHVDVVVWGRDRVLSQLLQQRPTQWRIIHRDPDYLAFERIQH